jgi:hypothetical protein
MKIKSLGLAGCVFALSQTSFAVDTKDCPANLSVSYKDLSVTKSVEEVLEELTESQGQYYRDELGKELGQVFQKLRPISQVNRHFLLESTKKGRCRYQRDVEFEKAEIYTQKGKTNLLVQTELGPRGILLRTYARVEILRPTGLVLSKANPGLALAVPRSPYKDYSAGGPLVFIGKVGEFKTSVRIPKTILDSSLAKIEAKNEDGVDVEIALNENSVPRINGSDKTYPTIKDFRDGGEFTDFCFKGTPQDVKNLIKGLVEAANGDGDSWAKLDSIREKQKGVLAVKVTIADEGGEYPEVFYFPVCR